MKNSSLHSCNQQMCKLSSQVNINSSTDFLFIFFSIAAHAYFRPLLRIQKQGTPCQWVWDSCLFTLILRLMDSLLQCLAARLLIYLDDNLIAAPWGETLSCLISLSIHLLSALRILIIRAKSIAIPYSLLYSPIT